MTALENNKGPLTLAALQVHMGDWTYYLTFMKMNDIKDRITRAQLIYSSPVLREFLQRELVGKRVNEISTYLQTQQQRFFNALVIGTYGGEPLWREITINDENLSKGKIPSDLEGTLGFLILNGKERLFAIDGQHRSEGIRKAVAENPELGNEEVGVILLRGITGENRTEDPVGFERTRRLFSTLNRYAKPVGKTNIISLDEDDTIAIITRKLVEEHPLFKDKKISTKHSTSIPVSDDSSFTSINALYDCLNIYLKDKTSKKWEVFKRFYPTDEIVDGYYQRTLALWAAYSRYFREVKELEKNDPESKIAGRYRNKDGGHLLFRPIGLLNSIRVIRILMDKNQLTLQQAVERISKMPMQLSNEPWVNLLWESKRSTIINRSINIRTSEKILLYGTGGNLEYLKSSPDELRNTLSTLLKVDYKDVSLRKYI